MAYYDGYHGYSGESYRGMPGGYTGYSGDVYRNVPGHGMPGMMPGMMGWVPRGVLPGRMEGIDFGRLAISNPQNTFIDTMFIIKDRLKRKYSDLPRIAINFMSFGQALYKHPFRNTVANLKYTPMVDKETDKKLTRYY